MSGIYFTFLLADGYALTMNFKCHMKVSKQKITVYHDIRLESSNVAKGKEISNL